MFYSTLAAWTFTLSAFNEKSHTIPGRGKYRKTTQPGYTCEKYLKCMSIAQTDIIYAGLEKFCALEPGMPIARIYDKLTFATGSRWFQFAEAKLGQSC
jgi:hypothetical protein